jgi:hypothetical protein
MLPQKANPKRERGSSCSRLDVGLRFIPSELKALHEKLQRPVLPLNPELNLQER